MGAQCSGLRIVPKQCMCHPPNANASWILEPVSLPVTSPTHTTIRRAWAQALKSGRQIQAPAQPLTGSANDSSPFLICKMGTPLPGSLSGNPCERVLLVTEMLGEWFSFPLHAPKAWPSPDAETGGGSASLNVLPWQRPLPPAQMSAVLNGVLSPPHC